MNATRILYQAAGSPPATLTHHGACRMCGGDGDGIAFDAWVRDTFTNHDQLLPGDIICGPCQFAFAQDSRLLQERTGKDKPQRMQNYSHVVLRGQWYPLHKGQKVKLLSLLRQSPELVAIGVSGQKHIVFRARPGWWQVEEQCVAPNLPALDACLYIDQYNLPLLDAYRQQGLGARTTARVTKKAAEQGFVSLSQHYNLPMVNALCARFPELRSYT